MIKHALFVRLEAKPGKKKELGDNRGNLNERES
jgi:hypothetical protein